MKQVENIDKYILRFRDALHKARSISDALTLLSTVYKELENDHTYFGSFKLELIDTRRIQSIIYYQKPPGISDETIKISSHGYEGYIWKDSDGWCLDDDYWGADKISRELVKCFVCANFPENVRELKDLLKGGFWALRPNLPCFGGLPPDDINEVISWDNRFVLVGTKIDNLVVVSRDEWEELCKREQNWFNE